MQPAIIGVRQEEDVNQGNDEKAEDLTEDLRPLTGFRKRD